MGFFKSSKKGAELSVGPELAAVLPKDPKPWYKTAHLIKLNAVILVLIFSSATIGFDGAMMNGLQTVKLWRDYFGTPTASILGVMNAVYPIGKIMGLFPATWVSDRYGRKTPLWIGGVAAVIGAALQGGSINIAMFIVSRWFLGVATAFLSLPSPILITELAYPTHRGKVTSLYNTFFYAGAILAAGTTFGTFSIPSSWSWRIPSLMQGAIPFLQFCVFYFVPESPRWLVNNGKAEKAREIFVHYHAGGDESSPLIDYEINEIEENLRVERAILSQSSYFDLLKSAPNRKRTLIAFIIGFGAQWNGVSVTSYYLTIVLNTIGITQTKDQTLINLLLNVWNWVAAVFAGAMMVDRLGRRKLFLISTGGMFCFYAAWTAMTAVFVGAPAGKQDLGNTIVAFIFIFYFFYNLAWSPLLQAYPVEIFQYTLRSRGLTVTMGSTFVGLIIAQFVNPIALTAIGWKYYLVFCCLLLVLFTAIWFLCPETKGRTLEQIAELFDGTSHTLGHVGDDQKGGDERVSEVEEVRPHSKV